MPPLASCCLEDALLPVRLDVREDDGTATATEPELVATALVEAGDET